MAGGVRVLQPAFQGTEATPEIDTVQVVVEGEKRDRQRVVVLDGVVGTAQYGQTLAVPGATMAVVVTVVAPASYRLAGFTATGTGDGHFTLSVDGDLLLADRIDNLSRACQVLLPRAVPVRVGGVVELHVQNQTTGTRDYEATIFGEVLGG